MARNPWDSWGDPYLDALAKHAVLAGMYPLPQEAACGVVVGWQGVAYGVIWADDRGGLHTQPVTAKDGPILAAIIQGLQRYPMTPNDDPNDGVAFVRRLPDRLRGVYWMVISLDAPLPPQPPDPDPDPDPEPDKTPAKTAATPGQKRILQFASRANQRLRARRTTDAWPVYELVELSPDNPPRLVMLVRPAMVANLAAEGWIEPIGDGQGGGWSYRVTEAGLHAKDDPPGEPQ